MVKHNDIISQCYINLTDAIEKYQDNWICDETWFRVISARYPDVINSVGFSRAAFNRAISCRASQCGTPNDSGIFMHHFQMPCLYEGKKKGRKERGRVGASRFEKGRVGRRLISSRSLPC